MRPELAGVLLAALSACAFGTVAILARKGYEEGADPLPLLGFRFAIASVLLLALVKAMRRRVVPGRNLVGKLLLLGGIGFALESSLFFIALDKAPVGIVSLVFFSFPMFTALLSWILRIEPVDRRTVIALALGSIGIASIFSIRDLNLEGPFLALLGALAVAVYYVGTGVVMRTADPLVAAFWTAVGAGASVLAISFATGQNFPLSALPWAAAIGAVTATAFAAMYGSIARIGASRSAVAQMLEPVVTVLLGLVVLNEEITLRIALGAVLIISALPILAAERKEPPPPADSV